MSKDARAGYFHVFHNGTLHNFRSSSVKSDTNLLCEFLSILDIKMIGLEMILSKFEMDQKFVVCNEKDILYMQGMTQHSNGLWYSNTFHTYDYRDYKRCYYGYEN